MTATTFNPLATARALEATGIERRQAEAIAEGAPWRAMREAAGADRADLATKADLAGFAKSRPPPGDRHLALGIALDARLSGRAHPRDGRQAVRYRMTVFGAYAGGMVYLSVA